MTFRLSKNLRRFSAAVALSIAGLGAVLTISQARADEINLVRITQKDGTAYDVVPNQYAYAECAGETVNVPATLPVTVPRLESSPGTSGASFFHKTLQFLQFEESTPAYKKNILGTFSFCKALRGPAVLIGYKALETLRNNTVAIGPDEVPDQQLVQDAFNGARGQVMKDGTTLPEDLPVMDFQTGEKVADNLASPASALVDPKAGMTQGYIDAFVKIDRPLDAPQSEPQQEAGGQGPVAIYLQAPLPNIRVPQHLVPKHLVMQAAMSTPSLHKAHAAAHRPYVPVAKHRHHHHGKGWHYRHTHNWHHTVHHTTSSRPTTVTAGYGSWHIPRVF